MINRAPQHSPMGWHRSLQRRLSSQHPLCRRPAATTAALFVLLAGSAGCAPRPAPRKTAPVERVDARSALGLHTRESRIEFGSQPKQIMAGEPALWSLKILESKRDEEGRSPYIRTFDAGGRPLLHLFVVSKDLTYFSHLLPTYKDYGHFLVEPTLPRAGDYKLFAVYTPHGGRLEAAQHELNVTGETPLAPPARPTISPMEQDWLIERAPSVQPVSSDSDGGGTDDASSRTQSAAYQVALKPMPSRLVAGAEVVLRFQVRDAGGQPLAALQPHNGESGHCIIVSEDTRICLDARPVTSQPESRGADVAFRTRFPVPGVFKVWGQFRHEEQVVTAPFVLRVEAKPASRTKSPR